jgi:hypothetical protein
MESLRNIAIDNPQQLVGDDCWLRVVVSAAASHRVVDDDASDKADRIIAETNRVERAAAHVEPHGTADLGCHR